MMIRSGGDSRFDTGQPNTFNMKHDCDGGFVDGRNSVGGGDGNGGKEAESAEQRVPFF